jgi:hypothetical protein
LRFDKQQRQVVFHACRTGGPGDPPRPNVNILVYDQNGTEIQNIQGIECDLNGALVPVTIVGEHITWINVYGAGAGWGLDDLEFETDPPPQPPPLPPPPAPPPPPAKDFALRFADGVFTPRVLALRPGQTITRELVIERNESSFGPIRLVPLRFSGGLRATVTPSTVSGAGVEKATLTITADRLVAPRYLRTAAIRAEPSPTAGTANRLLTFPVLVQGQLAVWVEGIEITQGVQTDNQPREQTYNGVRLVRGKKTVVRVFVDFRGAEPQRARGLPPRPPVGMALYGTDASGRALPGSPLVPDWSPPSKGLSLNDPALIREERESTTTSFVFVLPERWTRGPITLTARALAPRPSQFAYRLRPEPLAAALCIDTRCGASPSWTLRGVTFADQPRAKVISALEVLSVLDGKLTGIPTPAERTFEKLLALSPIPFVFLNSRNERTPWPTYRAVRFAPGDAITETTQAWDDDTGRLGDLVLGVFASPGGGGYAPGPRVGVADATRDANGDPRRPVTVVAHEMLHLLGLGHADTACGGGGAGFPDPDGRMRSVGLDTTVGSGGSAAGDPPYRVIPDNRPASPGFDLMSYCNLQAAGDPQHWISARHWNYLLGLGPPPGTRRLAGRAGIPSLTVRARVTDGQVAITSVRPVQASAVPPPAAASHVLVARDAGGAIVSSTPMQEHPVEGAAGAQAYVALEASVPAANVARLEIVRAGSVVASADRSKTAPTVRFLAPGEGARVRGRGLVTVLWLAADADGDPLDVSLDYSTDGGRTFTTVAGGVDRGGVKLPVELLAASTQARLRLRVNDGFNSASATVALVVEPRAPLVTILEPGPGQRSQAGSALYLRGGAVDDRGRRIPPGRLRWYAGARLLGAGDTLSAALPAGTRAIRLVATDRSGRSGSASVPVRTQATFPFFLRLDAPRRLSRNARALTLTAASTQPASLRIAGLVVDLGRSARRLSVPVSPGTSALTLRLVLTAGGKSTTQVVVVPRR